MPYFGYIEVEVRLMREGHGLEGKEVAPVAKRTVRIGEMEARKHTEGAAGLRAETDKLRDAILDVLGDDDMAEMEVRWREATKDMTPTKMKAALEVLERG